MKIKIKKKIQEMSGMTGSPGSISGHVDNRKKLEESGVTSNVSQNDSTGYTSEVTFNGITNSGRDYQVVQELGIQRTSEDNYVTRHQYPEIYKMIGECLPDSIKKTSFEQRLVSYDIDFKILYIEIDGEPLEFDSYDENIFSKMDSLKFFRHIMKEVGEYIVANPDKVYYFYGIHSGMEMDTTVESMRTKLYKMFLKRLYRMLPGNWKTATLKDVNQILFWKCPSKQAELVFESKETDFTNEEIDLIHEQYFSSGALANSGGHYDRSKEGHERYVRMRFINQGLQNFKPNRYFVENKDGVRKIKIKIRKNLEEKCQKGYKTHEKRKTKKMFGKTYRNCVKAESMEAPNSELEAAKKAMLGYNIDIDKQIGRGMFGIVYYGISDEIGPVAVKQLERAEGVEEIKRYKEVDLARSKSSYVAKHFPKVHLIQDDATKDPEYVYIVLEILGVEQGYQREVIDMLFRTSGTSKDSNKFSRPTGNKIFVLFNDEKTQKLVYQKFNRFFDNKLAFLKPVFDKYFSYFYDFVQNKKYSKKVADSITDLPISKDFDVEYVMKSGMKLQRASINSVEKLKTRFKDNPWYLAFITMQLKQLLKKDKELFNELHIRIMTYWVDFYDKSTVMGTSDSEDDPNTPHDRNFYQTSGLPKQQSGLFKESDSLKKAISDLKRLAKLQVRDLKADNTMVRPQTGDIVIVDLGLFKKT